MSLWASLLKNILVVFALKYSHKQVTNKIFFQFSYDSIWRLRLNQNTMHHYLWKYIFCFLLVHVISIWFLQKLNRLKNYLLLWSMVETLKVWSNLILNIIKYLCFERIKSSKKNYHYLRPKKIYVFIWMHR